jgi:hypothetical protein
MELCVEHKILVMNLYRTGGLKSDAQSHQNLVDSFGSDYN